MREESCKPDFYALAVLKKIEGHEDDDDERHELAEDFQEEGQRGFQQIRAQTAQVGESVAEFAAQELGIWHERNVLQAQGDGWQVGDKVAEGRNEGEREQDDHSCEKCDEGNDDKAGRKCAWHPLALQKIDGRLQEELQEEREENDECEIGEEPEGREQERKGDAQDDGCAVVCQMHGEASFSIYIFIENGKISCTKRWDGEFFIVAP